MKSGPFLCPPGWRKVTIPDGYDFQPNDSEPIPMQIGDRAAAAWDGGVFFPGWLKPSPGGSEMPWSIPGGSGKM